MITFPLTCTDKFNKTNALLLAQASELVYKDEAEIAEYLKKTWGFKKYRYFDKQDSQAFLAEHHKVLVLAFRGTESWADAKTDIDIRKSKVKYGEVHRGFKRAFNRIWKDILKTLKEFSNDDKPLYITGHSLGGALAMLAAEQFIANKCLEQLNGVYTFGQPRVGNSEFADGYDIWLRRKTFRFVNNQDIVTRLPRPYTGFQHAGKMLFFDSFGRLHDRASFFKRLFNEIIDSTLDVAMFYRIFIVKYPDSIRNHFISEYIKLLEKLNER